MIQPFSYVSKLGTWKEVGSFFGSDWEIFPPGEVGRGCFLNA